MSEQNGVATMMSEQNNAVATMTGEQLEQRIAALEEAIQRQRQRASEKQPIKWDAATLGGLDAPPDQQRDNSKVIEWLEGELQKARRELHQRQRAAQAAEVMREAEQYNQELDSVLNALAPILPRLEALEARRAAVAQRAAEAACSALMLTLIDTSRQRKLIEALIDVRAAQKRPTPAPTRPANKLWIDPDGTARAVTAEELAQLQAEHGRKSAAAALGEWLQNIAPNAGRPSVK